MIRRSNSVTGLRFMSRAVALAMSIKRGSKRKRQVLDGFIVEGSATNGKFHKATVLDIPQDAYLLQLELLDSSRANYAGGDTYSLPSRDPINPNMQTKSFAIPLAKEGNYTQTITLYDTEKNYYIFSLGKIVLQKECGSGSMYASTDSNYQGYEDITNPVLVTGFEPAGTNRHNIINCAVEHNQIEPVLGNGTAGQRLRLFTKSVSIDDRNFASNDTESRYVGRLSTIEPCPISWFYNGKCYTVFPYYDDFGLLIPWEMDEQEDPQISLVSRMGLAQLEHYVNEAGEGRVTLRMLDYLSKLPEWLTKVVLDIKRPWREYEEVKDENGNVIDYVIIDGGIIETATYNSIQLNIQTARVIEDDDNSLGLAKGATVIAATLKTFVPFTYGDEQWFWDDEASKWALPVFGTVPLDMKNQFFSDMYGKYFNNEIAYPVLVALKIVVLGGVVLSVEVLDSEILCSKKLIEVIEDTGATFEFPFEKETFSTEFMLDVLNDGKVMLRKKILERPEGIFEIKIDFSTQQAFNIAVPYYKTTIDGVDVTASVGSGVENKSIYYTAPYPLHISRSKDRERSSYSCRISKETTALPWYEPRQDNNKCDVGIMFTDGNRFLTELDGFTDGEIIGVSCPQEEIRVDGNLKTPSVIVAVIYKENVPVANGEENETITGYFAMIRKGPIWPEDMADNFKPANPTKSNSLKWWSDPAPMSSERAAYGILYCRGSKLIDKLHGEYFKETNNHL